VTQADGSASEGATAPTDLEGALSAADVEWRALALGTVTLHVGRRA
jgi:hypothetical protein